MLPMAPRRWWIGCIWKRIPKVSVFLLSFIEITGLCGDKCILSTAKQMEHWISVRKTLILLSFVASDISLLWSFTLGIPWLLPASVSNQQRLLPELPFCAVWEGVVIKKRESYWLAVVFHFRFVEKVLSA